MGRAVAPGQWIAFAREAERVPDFRLNRNLLRNFRRDQKQRQQVITRRRRARRIGAEEPHQGAGGRVGAAAPAMRVDGGGG